MQRQGIPPGTLYLLILKTLARSALQRMLIKGWVTAEWGVTAENRPARYYRLTGARRYTMLTAVCPFRAFPR